jgi:hypothetical protein
MNTKTDNTMQDTQLDGMYRMASKFLGYSGPKTKEALEQFRQSSPAVSAKMKRYSNAMAKGGLMRKGYQVGGTVIDASIQPVRPTEPRVGLPAFQFGAYNDPNSKLFQQQLSDQQMQDMYQQAQADAQRQRSEGFMGRAILPGEMSFDQFSQNYYNTGVFQPMQQQQLGNLRPNMFVDRPAPYRSDELLRKEYDALAEKARQERANGNLSQVVLPGEQPFEEFLALRKMNMAPMPASATAQPTAATPFLQTPALPTAPTLEEIPEGATDEQKAEIEARNAAAQEQYKQQSMSALNEAQRQAVMATMTPYRPGVAQIQPTAGTEIAAGAGQVTGAAPVVPTAVAPAAVAQPTAAAEAAQVTPSLAQPEVAATLAGVEAAKGQVSPEAQVAAATQAQTSVSNLEAAQGTAVMMDNPVQRQIEAGELISGAANAATAAAFTEQVEAATATPTKKATVAGQLEGLMADFEGGATPAWAAGAMRTATQMLAARGLGASSMAGQAVIQAAMEAALPIAQADAAVTAQFEMQNLSNRQQRAMLAAQQRATFLGQEFDQAFQARVANSARIGDIANMNFTAEQQIALENSRAANTVNLTNLSNRQAMVMAEAAALSQLDITNLNNRQQAAVQNAQNFMQMDLTNLSNEQQTSMFKAQQNVQALFTDQAAENAAQQFNATSDNQTNQFFAQLAQQTNQFNASQVNAMNQFNIDQANAIGRFNAELIQQREQFNAANSLVVEQANATWRQNIATLNTAATNEANMLEAQTLNNLTMANIEQIWQRERDLMSYSIQTANNNADRATTIAVQQLANEASADAAAAQKSSAFASAAGSIVSSIIFG